MPFNRQFVGSRWSGTLLAPSALLRLTLPASLVRPIEKLAISLHVSSRIPHPAVATSGRDVVGCDEKNNDDDQSGNVGWIEPGKMSASQPIPESFQETFCAQYGVPPSLYGTTVLRLTLYPHARWLADVSADSFLAPDRFFIVSVGRLKRWREFAGEAEVFQHLPANSRFWRRRLRLRVSINRMRVLFSEVMGGTPSIRPNKSRLQDETRTRGEPGSLAAE